MEGNSRIKTKMHLSSLIKPPLETLVINEAGTNTLNIKIYPQRIREYKKEYDNEVQGSNDRLSLKG